MLSYSMLSAYLLLSSDAFAKSPVFTDRFPDTLETCGKNCPRPLNLSQPLPVKWNVVLVMGSIVISFMGCWSTVKMLRHLQITRSYWKRRAWMAIASFTFGGCAVWSAHFTGMLAMDIGGRAVRYEPNPTLISCVIAVVCSHVTYWVLDYQIIRNPLTTPLGTSRDNSGWPWRKFSSATIINNSQYVPLVNNPDTNSSSPKIVTNVGGFEHSLRVGTIDDEETHRADSSSSLLHSSSTPSFHQRNLSSDELEAEQNLLSECLNDEIEPDICEQIPISKKFLAGFLLTIAIASMHYLGMYAMRINAVVRWNWAYIVLSVLLAWFFSAIAVLLSSSNIANRDFFSSLSQVAGIGGLHYSGTFGASFYPKSPDSNNPTTGAEAETNRNELAFAVGMFTVSACFLACNLAAQATSNSRNRLKAIILVQKRMKKLTTEKEAAEKANEMKSSFVASVSHEIRTPMHAVNGFLELLSKTKLTAEQQEYIEMIQNGSNILQNIINDILDFSKLERDQFRLQSHPFDIIAIAESTVKATSTMASEDVEVMLNVSPDCFDTVHVKRDDGTYVEKSRSLMVMGDLYRFQQIVMNLVSNALKFTVSGYVLVTLAPVCTAARDENEIVLRLSVEDSGPGISKEDQNKLFQPFSQLETIIAPRFGGTGLGLVICKQLIQLKKGTIDITSEINRGTTVTCEVPLRRLTPSERLAYITSISSREFSGESNACETENFPTNTNPPKDFQRVTALLTFQSKRTRDAIGQILFSTWGIHSVTTMEELESSHADRKIWISDTASLESAFEPKGDDVELRDSYYQIQLILALPFHHRIGDLPNCAPKRIREGLLYVMKKPIVFQKLVDIITDVIEQPCKARTQDWNLDDVLETIPNDTRSSSAAAPRRTVSANEPVAIPEAPALPTFEKTDGRGTRSISRSTVRPENAQTQQTVPLDANDDDGDDVNDGLPSCKEWLKSTSMSRKPSPPISLPMKVPNFKYHRTSSTTSLSSHNASNGELSTKGTCLLVEDNPINVKLGTMFLMKLNYEVDVAEDGLLALEKIESEKKSYDIILMDLQMPRMGGVEATRRVRMWESKRKAAGVSETLDGKTRPDRIPIIAVSANIYAQKDCEKEGFDDFMAKPLKMGDLQATLDKFVNKTRIQHDSDVEGRGATKPARPSV